MPTDPMEWEARRFVAYALARTDATIIRIARCDCRHTDDGRRKSQIGYPHWLPSAFAEARTVYDRFPHYRPSMYWEFVDAMDRDRGSAAYGTSDDATDRYAPRNRACVVARLEWEARDLNERLATRECRDACTGVHPDGYCACACHPRECPVHAV